MKKKELQEKRNKPLQDLIKEINQKEKDLAKIRLELVSGSIKNVHTVRALRRDIAQLKTVVREKEINQKS